MLKLMVNNLRERGIEPIYSSSPIGVKVTLRDEITKTSVVETHGSTIENALSKALAEIALETKMNRINMSNFRL